MQPTGQSQGVAPGLLWPTITAPSFWASNMAMVRKSLILTALLPLWVGLFACASREEIHAERVARQVAAEAEDDTTCRRQGAPGGAAYDACRKTVAAQRARKAEIDYQKARDFDRVLGAGTDGLDSY